MAYDDSTSGNRNAQGTADGSSPGGRAPTGEGQSEGQGQADKPSMLPAITTPTGGGAIKGIGEKFEVAAATGTAGLSVPLPVSPGRNGFGPSLGLSYSSGHGNGPFGLGFALSVPTITRKTDKGLPRYYDPEESDEYILSSAEDLVPNRKPNGELDVIDPPAGDRKIQRYRPRVEGLFARIERHTMAADGSVHWEVTTKDNVTHTYGRTAATRIVDPNDATRVFSWLLEESKDDRGDFVVYEYKAEDGKGVTPTTISERSRFERQTPSGPLEFVATAQRYLKRVRYTNFAPNVANDFLFELVFDYGDHQSANTPTPTADADWPVRIDPFSSYRSGFEVRTYRLCKRVLMFHRLSEAMPRPALLVRSTDFIYDDPTPAFTYLTRIIQYGYLFDGANPPNVDKKPMPTLALDYVRPVVNDQLAVLPPGSLEGLTGGIDGSKKQWVDLDGEGIPGVLIDEQTAWYYKSNRGGGQLTAPRALSTMPAPAMLTGGAQQLQDLAGDGQLDLVSYAEPIAGYATRTPEGDFDPLRAFQTIPNINWRDPDLRFVDLDGDGLPDLLITEDQAFIWYRSLSKVGFEQARRVAVGFDEDRAPTLAYTDDTQAVQLADMSGDGLVDIVRVRNGEVAYWPNLGYGRFGAKVTLANSPVLAQQEEFDPRRIRFGDVDGTGTSDLFYLGRNDTKIYFNQSGNALSAATVVSSLPPMDDAARVAVVDILGTGTASLVWSSPLPGMQGRHVMYVDLMASKKPHLMKSIVNNLGATTLMTYAPSTKFYLADKAAGTPWLTRLAFPVHVVETLEHFDAISNSHLTSSYTYHHGFFDGVERELRGFARVEQTDAESFTLGSDTTEFQAPTLTKSWYHTGAWLEKETLEKALAREYFPPGPKDVVPPLALLLPDTILTGGMTIQDEREAARALRGRMLHQEVYALDADVKPLLAPLPFAITEQSFEVKLLQTSKGGKHGVFFTFPRETIAIHTERNPADPRVTHDFTLTIDAFGNVQRKATIAYGRSATGPTVQQEQQRAWATMAEMSYINNPGASEDPAQFYRLGLPYETIRYELTGLGLPLAGQGLISRDGLETAIAASIAANDVAYDVPPFAANVPGRRMLDRKQQLYYDNDPVTGVIGAAAAPQHTGSLALPFESYQLALTAGLAGELVTRSAQLTGIAFDPTLLLFNGKPGTPRDKTVPQGYYVRRPNDSGYWVASGQIQFVKDKFYVPGTLTDPFGFSHAVVFDKFNLLVERTQDPLGNTIQAQNDYRVLLPFLVTDANLNRAQRAFDAHGMVTATAVMGKTTESFGDTIANPTTSFDYHLLNWQDAGLPAFVHEKARETHGTSPPPKFQESFTYSDGFGRVAMKKVQAEPDRATPTVPRWVGTGRTVFNNKGKPVKQYEPFFSATSDFESETAVVQAGVTPIIHYDALDRVVRTELPNGTESGVEFDPWQQISSDPNDTVLGTKWYSDRGSPPATQTTQPSAPEQRAAWLAARHAGTPTVTQFDALGRPFLLTEQNRTWDDSVSPATFTDAFFETRMVLDVEGNALAILDPRQAQRKKDNPAITLIYGVVQRFDVLSRVLRVDSIDGGTRLMVADVASKALFGWDTRSQIARNRYDELQRSTHLFVQKTRAEGSGQPGETPDDLTDRLLIRTIYGETLDLGVAPPLSLTSPPAPPSAAQALNLRGQPYLLYDCAGKVKNGQFDFKGNLISSTRRLASEFRTEPNWSAITEVTDPATAESAADTQLDTPVLSPAAGFTVFAAQMTYDALNRVVSRTTPDGSVTVPTYNAAGLLETVSVTVQGAASPATVVSNIDYNARGQRLTYDYADPVAGTAQTCEVTYQYDPFTFRLTHLTTQRAANPNVTPQVSAQTLQALVYTYDPVGNVVETDDGANPPDVFTVVTTPLVTGDGLYRYDSIYRLIRAEGREHPGQQPQSTQPRGNFDIPIAAVPHPNDPQALLRYKELYAYDQTSNIQSIAHTTTQANGQAGGSNTIWTRSYTYEDTTNRLSSNNDPDFGTATYGYTGNGAMNKMAHLRVIEWDYADRMRHANKTVGTAGDVFFTYDGSGQRVRKVFVTGTLAERIYVGGWETYRTRSGTTGASPLTLERRTLHVMDDKRRIAMIETTVAGAGPSGPQWRFQLGNLLDSAVMELDPAGRVVSYEEYHPYGSTAFQSFGSATLSAKRYRYTGKERDEETGLYYHGARYYVPWLGRWTAADPAGMATPLKADPNMYAYARGRPLNMNDPSGRQAADASKYTSFEEFVSASPKVYSNEFLMSEWEKAHGPVNGAAAPAPQAETVAKKSSGSSSSSSSGGYSSTTAPIASGMDAAVLAAKVAYTPVSPTGAPLQGPLNLFSGTTAYNAAKAAPGYTIEETIYLAQGEQAQAAELARLGLAPGSRLPLPNYLNTWGPPSRNAVLDAMLGGEGVVFHNDLSLLPANKVLTVTEFPTFRAVGAGLGVFNLAGGGLMIISATDPEFPAPLVPVAVTSGSLSATGGLSMLIGTAGGDAAMVGAGSTVTGVGAVIGIPVMMYGVLKLEAENQKMMQPIINDMIEKKNYVGAALLSMPPPGMMGGF
jgi:RHS repeat-associated protein